MTEPRAPSDSTRTVVIGRTGTGKSQFGLDLLSRANFDEMPWVMVDYKGEDLIDEIMDQNKGRIKTISVKNKPPKNPGLYHMPLQAVVSDPDMERWMGECLAQGHIGLFVDEGYALPKFGNGVSFTGILTRGRSLKVPVICLYQRPVWMSRFAIAQADFISVFKQGDERDEKNTQYFCKPAVLPDGRKLGPMDLDRLPEYYSLWHDVGRGRTNILQPAPDRQTIMSNFRARLVPQQHKGKMV